MSGDVQPRKRKDKKRKKDDLGVDEPRGTAAALGEGDVFMHSHHDHGTGGHWCAKVIFFFLLFVLVGLIGLIILENRGLSELEANAVQSQYSGMLEGWLEDAPDDDHHDEHTLELNHHDDEHNEEGHSEEADDDKHDDRDVDDDDEHQDDEDEDERDTPEDEDDDDDEYDEDGSQEQDLEDNEEEDLPYRKYFYDNEAEPDDDKDEQDNGDSINDNDDDDDEEEDNDVARNDDDDEDDNDVAKNDDEDDDDDEEDNDVAKNDDDDDDDDEEENDVARNDDDGDDDQDERLSNEVDQDDGNDDDDEDQSLQQEDEDADEDSNEENNEDEEDHEEEEEDASLELEKIEKEAPENEEPISNELPALPEQDNDDDDDDKNQDSVEDEAPDAVDADDGDDADDPDDDVNDPDDDFLEAVDDEPPVERITAPAGKPFVEVEEPSTEKPTNSLAEEEEYEKRQEQLRKEEEASSHMWLKLSIGGALLVATHAIVRRATASSDAPRSEEGTREATPAIDRRMTLIPEEPSDTAPIKKVLQGSSWAETQEITKQIPTITRKSPTFEENEEETEEEEEEEPVVSKVVRTAQAAKEEEKKELYSDEEDEEDEDEEPVVEKKVAPVAAKPKEPTPEPEEDVPDDVEIIDDEQIEEEEEPEDEEEISDVDDEELLTRLEAKYGRLPEPERPARRKDGGNSLEDGWPGEPADAYWRQQLDEAEREFNQGAVTAAADRASAAQLKTSGRARWIVAKALDAAAEKKRDNALLGRAIAAYLELLKMNERLSDKKLLEIAERTINRIHFRGTYLNAEPVYRLLIRRFPNEPSHRTNLTTMFLMANRGDLAEEALKETLKRWPNDRLALAQYGFILKTQHNRLEEALDHLQKALEGDIGAATEPRFYYHLGDTLLLLGRFEEAHEVHKRGAAHGHFLSPAQRSLYNVPRLEGRPWWNIEDTPYVKLARDLENNWKAILREGEAAKALYEQEKEGLKERGEWSQLDLFVRGREIDGRCARAPVTCAVVRREPAAAGCRRGQVKFSSMRAGTHVRPHVGPTNCRLRMHLGLTNTNGTFIRVHKETRQWETGKVLMFDDSFEHEVWHNGTGSRLVLIVDVWHPGLRAAERRQLPAI